MAWRYSAVNGTDVINPPLRAPLQQRATRSAGTTSGERRSCAYGAASAFVERVGGSVCLRTGNRDPAAQHHATFGVICHATLPTRAMPRMYSTRRWRSGGTAVNRGTHPIAIDREGTSA